jgi:nucleoside-diphosphate-sugar epimerase
MGRESDVHLVIIGLGYSGAEVARQALARGARVSATSREPGRAAAPPGVGMLAFGAALPEGMTHVLATAPPDQAGDPVLRAYGTELADSRSLRWAGYLSTTGVYGDRGGAWVDEASAVAPGQDRSRRRVAAEQAWAGLAGRVAVDLFRVAGIYGPGRSALDEVRAGRARRVVKPGHAFGRIHVADIAGAVLAAAMQDLPAGGRVLHLADDVPAENAEVVAEAARLLGVAPPPEVPFDQALAGMSEMARSFWAENRRVSSVRTQEMLGYRWRYPSYREGMRAILAVGG